MKKVSNINLAFSCTENIDFNGEESFCSKCQNKVHDFRKFTKSALEEKLSNSDTPICGIFKKSQLDKKFIKYAASTAITLASISGAVQAQDIKLQRIDSVEVYLNDSIESEEEIFVGIILEEHATPIGGYEKFYNSILNELRIPKNLTSKAKAYVSIEIDTAGNISKPKIVNSTNPVVNDEALRVINQLQFKFDPAKQRGRPIKSKLILPLIFNPSHKEE
ncbi:energy transducer TonB [Fulvivirga sp.]|uniref:energy transducer TonB n=1 Tax=Fulvivirga sp. TaxID=1931237 RepID=UPI0032EF865D